MPTYTFKPGSRIRLLDRNIDGRMNLLMCIMILVAIVLVGDSVVGAMYDMAGKTIILENLVPGVNVPASEIGLNSGFIQASPQQLAIQVPHPVAVPVPHPILIPVERPVPFAVDRPVPYPVPVIKKYFIPVVYKVPVPDPSPVTHDEPVNNNKITVDDLEGRSEITAESFRIYNNGARRDRDSTSSADNEAKTKAEASPAPQIKPTKRRSSFLIRVNGS